MRKMIFLAFAIIMIINFVAYAVSAESEDPVKAYGIINFGDSEQLVEKKIIDDPNIYGDFLDFTKLGDLEFVMFFHYHEDKLWRITLKRIKEQTETSIKEDLNAVIQIIYKDYGDPSFSREINLDDVKHLSYVTGYIWDEEKTKEKKEIEAGIYKFSETYRVYVNFTYSPLFKNDIGGCKAYRDINFGDSEQLVIKKLSKDLKIDLPSVGGGLLAYVDYNESKFSMFFYYYKNQLYRIEFLGSALSASYLNTKIKEERDLLVQMISNKYGDPSGSWDVDLSDSDMGSHRWIEYKIGETKKISIGFFENTDSTYYSVMYIDYLPIFEQKKEEAEQKKKEELSNSSDEF